MADNTLKAIPINSLAQASAIDTDDQLIVYRAGEDNAYRGPVGLLMGSVNGNIAGIFDSSKSYEIGDYCIYNYAFYRCIAAHSGEWSDSDFEATTVGEEIVPLFGSRNCIYYEKYLGDHVTDEQWAEIKAGTFKGMYLGSYWTINGVNWRIMGFNYWLKTGDTQCTDFHLLIVPDTCILTSQAMNSSNTTEGGYIGSNMYTSILSQAKTTINNAFGSAHILNHREYLTNAITDGRPSGCEWVDSTVELMNEEMVYGSPILQQMRASGSGGYQHTINKSQLPGFMFSPDRITIRTAYWLRDISSASTFCAVSGNGYAGIGYAGAAYGVRPVFAIC